MSIIYLIIVYITFYEKSLEIMYYLYYTKYVLLIKTVPAQVAE